MNSLNLSITSMRCITKKKIKVQLEAFQYAFNMRMNFIAEITTECGEGRIKF